MPTLRKTKKEFETLCAESTSEQITSRSHQLPIYPTAAFCFDNLEEGIEIFSNQPGSHVYSRYGNPTVEAVAEKISLLETHNLNKSAFGLITSSGMAAIHLAMDAILKSGDAILTQPILYGGTTELFEKIFKKKGIDIIYADLNNIKLLQEILLRNSNIKAIFAESPVNPTLHCVDLESLTRFAIKNKLKTVIDNTFATPFLTQPFKFGVDIVIHSTTKYLHGHGASTGGAVITTDKNLFNKSLWVHYKLLGCNASPFEAWMIDLGLKTLTLRMKKQCQNAQKLAEYFDKHKEIIKVNYPGLKSHPSYKIAKKQMRHFGAMLSIEIKGNLNRVKKVLNKLDLCTMAPTLGETNTLILHPATMSHLKVSQEIKLQQGITDQLVRISVGLENIDDLIQDWSQALA